MNAPADAILAQAAYERGRQDGIKQERAMHEHSKLSQEIEAASPGHFDQVISVLDRAIGDKPAAPQADQIQFGDDADFPTDELYDIAMYGDRGNPKKMRDDIRAAAIRIAPQADQPGVPSQDGWITSPDGLSRRRAAPDAAAPHVPTPSVTLRFPFGRIASQAAAPSEVMEVLAELLEVVRQKDEVERERKNEAMNSNDWMQMKIRAEAAEGKLWDRARALVSEQSPGEQAEAAYQRAKQKDNAPRTSSGQFQEESNDGYLDQP